MQKLARLFANRLDHLRMAMAYSADRPAGEHIQNFVAIGIVNITSFTLNNHPRQPFVIGDYVFIEKLYRFLCRHFLVFPFYLFTFYLFHYFRSNAFVGVNLKQKRVFNLAIDYMRLFDARLKSD